VRPCAEPPSFETLVAYWAGDRSAADEEALEEHLMGCASCSAASARVAAITETMRSMIPPVLTRGMVEDLRARGLRVLDNPFAPGERREAAFPRDVDLLIFHLTGVDLTNVARVKVTLREEASGQPLALVDDAPFDREAGEVLLCCQRHFKALPPDVVVDVRVHDADGTQRESTYTILHRIE
jgi:hypothetical protein